MSYLMSMDCDKSAVKFTDTFSPPLSKRPQTTEKSSSMASLREQCIHTNDKCFQGIGDKQSHPCYVCHINKSEFSHDHGQHIDNSAILLHKISQLYENQDLSDIQIGVGSKIFHAHRLVLSSSSDVFKVMLTNPSWPESRTDQVILKEETDCIDVFEDFLKYMYTGNIHLTHYTAQPVLMLADKYNVGDLRAVCIQYMCDHLVSTTEHNHAISWLQYANTCGHESLVSCCHQFILCNFHKIINCKDFHLMDVDLVLKYVSCSELVIPDEFTLFKGISNWLLHKKSAIFKDNTNEFCNMALNFLSKIRFPMINPVQLSQLERDPLGEYFTEYFLEKMLIALNYHIGHTNQSEEPGMSPSQWLARNYTNEMWSTSLSIDNFVNVPPHDVRLMFFSSPISAAQVDENRSWEWNLDLFPKGIQFERCIMIGLWRNLEVCGTTYNNIRLVLSTKQPDVRKVDVSILIHGVQDAVEYVKHVVKRRCIFDKDKQMCHFNDIVPFDELNCTDSEYLSGSESNSFKITIIIKPV